MVYENKEEQSLGELFSELSKETRTLIRQEIELAKKEMSGKIARAVKDAAFLVMGGAVMYGGFLALLAAAIFGIGSGIDLWLAALIVGVVISGIGAAMALKGFNDLRKHDFIPRETMSTLREDTKWIKDRMQENR